MASSLYDAAREGLLGAEIDWDGAALDSTHIKAHRSATGARHQAARAEKGGIRATSGSGTRVVG